MGHQIIRQPDGNLAVFSTGTDSWILMDGSPQALEDYYAQRAADSARQSARETIARVVAGRPGEVYHQFAMTFAEANDLSREHGGDWWQDGAWTRG